MTCQYCSDSQNEAHYPHTVHGRDILVCLYCHLGLVRQISREKRLTSLES